VCALKEVQRLKPNSFVQQIEPAKDAMRIEEVGELFSAAFARVCANKTPICEGRMFGLSSRMNDLEGSE
jgi:hypothetical protein